MERSQLAALRMSLTLACVFTVYVYCLVFTLVCIVLGAIETERNVTAFWMRPCFLLLLLLLFRFLWGGGQRTTVTEIYCRDINEHTEVFWVSTTHV